MTCRQMVCATRGDRGCCKIVIGVTSLVLRRQVLCATRGARRRVKVVVMVNVSVVFRFWLGPFFYFGKIFLAFFFFVFLFYFN